MAENSAIEWTHHTMNFWVGCTALSPACDHCYAEAWAKRTGHPELWTGERRRTSATLWQQPLKWDRRCAAAGTRERVFTNSLADFFDNQVPSRRRDDAWHRIDQCRHLDWMVLSKRPKNGPKMLPGPATGAPEWATAGRTSGWARRSRTAFASAGSTPCAAFRPWSGSFLASRCSKTSASWFYPASTSSSAAARAGHERGSPRPMPPATSVISVWPPASPSSGSSMASESPSRT